MSRFQSVAVEGSTVRVRPAGRPEEVHTFRTPEEAQGRAAIVAEAISWIGTPFRDCADVKGPKGAVDCAMLAVRVYVDTGRLKPFDPRPYSPDHMRHSSEENFLGWIRDKLGAREVETPQLGDVPVWFFGQCHSHGGIVVNRTDVVHAYKRARMVMMSPMDMNLLKFVSTNYGSAPRPVKYFDVWSG